MHAGHIMPLGDPHDSQGLGSAPDGATLADLMRIKDRAELIAGRIVVLGPSGYAPAMAAGEVSTSLMDHARATGRGWAYMSKVAYAVPKLASGRESFSPNASYYDGPLPENRMGFLPGPPTLAVEVRDAWHYGPDAERDRAAKRADYFAAGTRVVWDVDVLAGTVHAYRADDPGRPAIFGPGEVADAEPAVPGWRMAIDDMFAH